MTRNIRTGAAESAGGFEGSTSVTNRTSALFAKRKFRAYLEFTSTTSVRIVATKPFYLASQKLWTGLGAVRAVVSTGGTPGGTFVALPTVFNLNTVGTIVAPTSTVSVGGTHTGGNEREVLRSDSSSAGGGSGSSDYVNTERYLAAGTYYIDLTVTGTTTAMYSIEWEEEA